MPDVKEPSFIATYSDRQVLARLLAYTSGKRAFWWAGLLMLLCATVADLMGPMLIKQFIDNQLVPGSFDLFSALWLAGGYGLVMLLAAGLRYRQAILFSGLALNVVERIRVDLFERVMCLPLAFFDRSATGALISRLTNDSEGVKELFVNVIVNALQNLFLLVCIFIAMAVLDVRLMALALALVPVTVGAMWIYKKVSAPLFHKARALLSDMNAHLNESLQAMQTLQVFNQQARFKARFDTLVESHFTVRKQSVRLDGLLLRALIDFISMLVLAAILGVFGQTYLKGAGAEIGVLYVFISYLGRFTEPLIEMTQRLNLLQQSLVAGQRVFHLMDEPSERYHEARVSNAGVGLAQNVEAGQNLIEFDRVTFGYSSDRPVIHEVSFSIPKGHFVALVGHTGSGKSTLASLLLRFYPLSEGQIRIGGESINTLPESVLRAKMGVVQQDTYIFNASLADNICLGQPLDRSRVALACEQAQLTAFVAGLPQGFDTLLGENGVQLSSGQKQLLSLARALVRDPEVLILDEATANVDSATEQGLMKTLRALRGKVTLVTIAHRLATIIDADQILVLHQGRLMQQGSHRELLATEGLYQHLYQLQALEQHLNIPG
ncbi:MAG: ATP-binding cassette domain-containing protein [Hahellaceae bacterium]|nr:ATP-binding cassette domain-containing protein [Hahellaceae bacterium]MCP5169990.1 ATP-binding cassette domain-containing protein [Hahellaceae bacterium]